MIYHRFPPRFVVKTSAHGLGVFATKNFRKGQLLFKMHGEISTHPTRTSVQIGKNKHIEDTIAAFVNHSCSPTAKVNKRTKIFVSLRNIKKGDEITFNYNKNEDKLASPFKCSCCGQKIKGRISKKK